LGLDYFRQQDVNTFANKIKPYLSITLLHKRKIEAQTSPIALLCGKKFHNLIPEFSNLNHHA